MPAKKYIEKEQEWDGTPIFEIIDHSCDEFDVEVYESGVVEFSLAESGYDYGANISEKLDKSLAIRLAHWILEKTDDAELAKRPDRHKKLRAAYTKQRELERKAEAKVRAAEQERQERRLLEALKVKYGN